MTDIVPPHLSPYELAQSTEIAVAEVTYLSRLRVKTLIMIGYLPDRPIISFTKEEIDEAVTKADEEGNR